MNLADLEVRRADTFVRRLLGLLRERRPQPRRALWLEPCAFVHTCGMRFPLDLVFLDRDSRILAVRERVPPWSIVGCPGARVTVELAAGSIDSLGIAIGQHWPVSGSGR